MTSVRIARLAVGTALMAGLGGASLFNTPSYDVQAQEQDSVLGSVTVGFVSRGSESDSTGSAPALSGLEQEALVERYLARREAIDEQATRGARAYMGSTDRSGAQARIVSDAANAEFHAPASSLFVGKNLRNTRANTAGVGSTLAETAVVNEGVLGFYMGNTHQEYTVDGGVTWTGVPFLPAAPASAPFVCCDEDVVYDQARGVTISLVLYINGANPPTRGVVRMWVRRNMNLAANCFYDYDPGVGVVADYPHINLTNDRLYLTTNEGATHSSPW